MSYLSFPRINFQGVFKTNPCTSNIDDVMVAVDPINVTLKPPLDAMTDDVARGPGRHRGCARPLGTPPTPGALRRAVRTRQYQ